MYIRTKDGIYQVTNDKWGRNSVIEEGGVFKLHYEGARGIHWWADLLPLNQSENLEELCDQIVYNGYLYQNKITWDGSLVEDSFEELEEPITDEMIKEGIYGAIWTDKGLIYVAKINDKGELELI